MRRWAPRRLNSNRLHGGDQGTRAATPEMWTHLMLRVDPKGGKSKNATQGYTGRYCRETTLKGEYATHILCYPKSSSRLETAYTQDTAFYLCLKAQMFKGSNDMVRPPSCLFLRTLPIFS